MEGNPEINGEIVFCRGCMKSDGVFLPMFGNDTKQKKLHEKLADLAAIQINQEDGLPTLLCSDCEQRTLLFYDFKKQVQETETKLRNMFDKRKIEEKIMEELSKDDLIKVDEDMYVNQLTNEWPVEDPSQDVDADENIKVDNFVDDVDSMDDINQMFLMGDTPEIKNKHYELTDNKTNIVDDNMDYTFFYLEESNDEEENVNLNIQNLETIDEKFQTIDENFETIDENLETIAVKLTPVDKELEILEIIDKKIEEPSTKNIKNSLQSPTIDYNDTSDSDNSASENLLGSLNDTMIKIKEIKLPNNKIEYQCTMCVENYPELPAILEHTVDNHIPKSGPFFCILCEKDCNTHKELRNHVKNHTGKNPYTCFICNKTYSTKRYLKRHMICHPEFERYRCSKCAKRFKLKNDLELHASVHIRGAPYNCNLCPRIFNHKGNYKRHLISHLDPHGVKLPKYPCEICGKRFPNNRTLVTHMRVHTGEQPFKCNICERKFSQQGNLFNHKKIHLNPRCYNCDICGKKFNQRSTLRDHTLLHTGEKPYVCNVCGVAFTFGTALRRHMWIHSGDKPYQCEICHSKFVGKYDLKRHMKTHSDDNNRKGKKRNKKIENIHDDDGNDGGNNEFLNVEMTEEINGEGGINAGDDNDETVFIDSEFLDDDNGDDDSQLVVVPEKKNVLFNFISYV